MDPCEDFPLKAEQSPWSRRECGQLRHYVETDEAAARCFEAGTVIVLGDSRARQVATEMEILAEGSLDFEA